MADGGDEWDTVAASWERGDEWYTSNVRPLTDWICDVVASPGAKVLDVACGTGQPALAIAARVKPGGRVTASDRSPAMLAAAARIARRAGLDNVDFLECEAESLGVAAGRYDSVSSSCGLMFCTDPVRAVSEMRRALVPQGRLAVAVWDEPSENPFFTTAGGVLGRLGSPATSAERPSAFSLSRPGELERLLLAAGFGDVSVRPLPMWFELESVEHYFRIFGEFAPGAAGRLASASASELAGARAALEHATRPFRSGGRLRLLATALCASGRAR